MTNALHSVDLACLRRAIELSLSARASGNEPYGAVLADTRGTILATAQNTQITGRDCTGHAETNLVRAIGMRIDRAALARATLYASGEPCPMCAGAIYWSGIGRVVYALSNESMLKLGGPCLDELRLSCRDVLTRGSRHVGVVGPLLEDEASGAFRELAP